MSDLHSWLPTAEEAVPIHIEVHYPTQKESHITTGNGVQELTCTQSESLSLL